MQSGDLDTLFDVFEQTDEKNSAGQLKPVWKKIGSFYGGVEPVNTQSFVQSGVQGSALICRVVMRPDDFPNISAAFQIKDLDLNKIYKITGVMPINKGKNALMCVLGKL